MKNSILIYLSLFIFMISACAAPNVSHQNSTNAGAEQPKQDAKDKKDFENLQKQFAQIASQSKGRVGVKVLVLETGESAGLKSDEPFPMQSVYKLPISMAILRQIDEGKLKLDQKVKVVKNDFVRLGQYSPIRDKNPNGVELSVEELIRYAVSESDGTASDVLFDLAGGAEAIKKYLDEIGVGGINILNSEKEIGKDWETQYRNSATPDAAVELLKVLQEKRGLSAESQTLLMKFLTDSTRGTKRLKGLLPEGTIVAHKTGTGGTRNGVTSATNDIGIVTLPNGKHLAIAVFVSDSPSDETTREAVIAKIAKSAWDEMSK